MRRKRTLQSRANGPKPTLDLIVADGRTVSECRLTKNSQKINNHLVFERGFWGRVSQGGLKTCQDADLEGDVCTLRFDIAKIQSLTLSS